MRTNNSNVIHRWANGLRARSGNDNLRTDGIRLVSYATCIARHTDSMLDGRGVTLITTRRYSVTTTGKHMPRAHDVPASRRVFFVAEVEPYGAESHARNVADMLAEIPSLARIIARDGASQEWAESSIRRACAEAREYARAFALAPHGLDAESIIADAKAKRAAFIARRDTPQAAARRAREAERRAVIREAVADAVASVRGRYARFVARDWLRSYASPSWWIEQAFKRAASVSAARAVVREAARELLRDAREYRAAKRADEAGRARVVNGRASALAAFPTLDAARDAWMAEGYPHMLAFAGAAHRRVSFDSELRHGRSVEACAVALACHMESADAPALRAIAEAAQAESQARNARMEAEREARMERERAAREAEHAALLARFPDAEAARNDFRATGSREGFRVWRGAERDAGGFDVIHVNASRGIIVTGRGAEAPLREAQAAFAFIRRVVDAGALPWTPRGIAGASAGGFALAHVDEAGRATFGCHVFTLAEMERAARDAEAASVSA